MKRRWLAETSFEIFAKEVLDQIYKLYVRPNLDYTINMIQISN